MSDEMLGKIIANTVKALVTAHLELKMASQNIDGGLASGADPIRSDLQRKWVL